MMPRLALRRAEVTSSSGHSPKLEHNRSHIYNSFLALVGRSIAWYRPMNQSSFESWKDQKMRLQYQMCTPLTTVGGLSRLGLIAGDQASKAGGRRARMAK